MGAVNNRLLELAEKFASAIGHADAQDRVMDWLISVNWDITNDVCPKELLLYRLGYRSPLITPED